MPIRVGGETFTDVWPHPEGDIPIRAGRYSFGGMAITWGLRKGSSYLPIRHRHAHFLTVTEGRGFFSIDGELRRYGPGSTFWIAGDIAHGFVDVEEDTIVVQQERPPHEEVS